ncbi:MAG: hypothetical protein MI808_09435 [Pseudomonadales bacterium]|nr:hypothetical protein [Pseudomonadales bacterium]
MPGKHKIATLGYFSLAAVGGFLTLQQHAQLANLTEEPVQIVAPIAYEKNRPMVAANTALTEQNTGAAPHLLQSLERAEAALAAVESIESAPEDGLQRIEHAGQSETWQLDLEKLQTPGFMLRDEIREYDVVTLNEEQLTLPSEGDQMRVPLLNGEQVIVDVKKSKVTRNGDYTWTGHVQGYGTDYPVVMTYGKNSSFAMITTPKGSYSMESVDGVGWLYKNPAEHELTLPGHEDFLEIPDQHTHHHGEENTMKS